jgi:hypothetical protein
VGCSQSVTINELLCSQASFSLLFFRLGKDAQDDQARASRALTEVPISAQIAKALAQNDARVDPGVAAVDLRVEVAVPNEREVHTARVAQNVEQAVHACAQVAHAAARESQLFRGAQVVPDVLRVLSAPSAQHFDQGYGRRLDQVARVVRLVPAPEIQRAIRLRAVSQEFRWVLFRGAPVRPHLEFRCGPAGDKCD